MSVRKIKEEKQKMKGLPTRKSMAGPTLLGTFTQPGAIKKSMAPETFKGSRSSSTDNQSEEPLNLLASSKDYSSLNGRVTVSSIM